MSIFHHPAKFNMVVGAISRLSIGSTAHFGKGNTELAEYMQRLHGWESDI